MLVDQQFYIKNKNTYNKWIDIYLANWYINLLIILKSFLDLIWLLSWEKLKLQLICTFSNYQFWSVFDHVLESVFKTKH